MRLLASILALLFMAGSAEARRHVVKQAPPPPQHMSFLGFGWRPTAVAPAPRPAPRKIARHARPQHVWHTVRRAHPKYHLAAAPVRTVQAPKKHVKGPALYALTKTTARALGVTDHSLLFEPISRAPVDHLPKKAPWAGALVF